MAKFMSEPLPEARTITEAIPLVRRSSFTTINSNECGSGSFGTVSMATHPDYNKVAIKILKNTATRLDWDQYKREAQKMKKLSAYPQIIKVHCIIEETHCWGIVMEWMEHGDLQSFQKKLTDFPWPLRMKMLLEVVEGMYFLHHVEKPAIIHRDLKAINIFVNENLSIRIGDLGLSASIHSVAVAAKGGTPTHMPPEFFKVSEEPNPKWDVYSFGILMYEVSSGHEAYPALGGDVHRLKCLVLYGDERPDLKKLSCDCPQSLIDLMKKCWDKEPKSRPTFIDIKDTVKEVYEKSYEININGAKKKVYEKLDSLKTAQGDSATKSNKDSSSQDEFDAKMSPNVNKDMKDTVKEVYENNGAKKKVNEKLDSLKTAHVDSATTSNKDSSSQDEKDASPNVNTGVLPDLTELDLLHIANHIGTEWKSLATVLGHSKAQVDHCVADNPYNSLDQIVVMLNKWRLRTPNHIQSWRSQLVAALRELDNNYLASRIERDMNLN